jgi:Na+/alanine symporter
MLFLKGVGFFVSWFSSATWRSFICLFLFSSIVSLYRFGRTPIDYLVPNAKWELGAVAISLAQSGRFADPYMLPSGPTAHLPPAYP